MTKRNDRLLGRELCYLAKQSRLRGRDHFGQRQPRSQGPLLLGPVSRHGGRVEENPGNEMGSATGIRTTAPGNGNEKPTNCLATQQPVLQSFSAISNSAKTCLKLASQIVLAAYVSGGEELTFLPM